MRRLWLVGIAGLLAVGCGAASSPSAAPADTAAASDSPSASPSASASASPTLSSVSPTPSPTKASPTPTAASPRAVTLHYFFPVSRCSASPSSSHHDYPASDIFTKKGCRFVAVVAGRVDEVTYVDRWSP